jgi:hypothetical protein
MDISVGTPFGVRSTKKAAAEMTKAAEAPNDLGGSISAKRLKTA